MRQSRVLSSLGGIILLLAPILGCSDDAGESPRAVNVEFGETETDLVEEMVEDYPGLVIRPVRASPAAVPQESALDIPGEQEAQVEVQITPAVVFTEDLGQSILDLDERRSVSVVRLSSDRITDEDLEFLSELEGVHKLIIEGRRISDIGLEHLGEFEVLDELRLVGCSITDDGLAELRNLKSLQTLWVNSPKLTGVGFTSLTDLSNLKSVYLSGSPIVDDGLQQIAKIASIETMVLDGTKITDKGMQHLAELHRLKLLNVESTKVTPQGVIDVQSKIRGVRILH